MDVVYKNTYEYIFFKLQLKDMLLFIWLLMPNKYLIKLKKRTIVVQFNPYMRKKESSFLTLRYLSDNKPNNMIKI